MAMSSCLRCLAGMAGSSLAQKHISVIGTGNYGAAIGKRLVQYGYDVTYGSRQPKSRNMAAIDPSLARTETVEIGTAIRRNNVVLFAIRVSEFRTIARNFSEDLEGKIIIDVSNRSKDVPIPESNAEFLQKLLPNSSVVKAFNVISAYTLESGLDGSSRVVPIASEDVSAKEAVANLVTSLDFVPKDAGRLAASGAIENSVLEVFPMWRVPVFLSVVMLVLCWLYIVYLYFITGTGYFTWEQLFVKLLNKPLAMTAVNMFAVTYLPGTLAGILQLYRGTKSKRFPRWLDFWLRSRKQLGLTAFTLAALHALVSAMLLSPTYYASWFHKSHVTIPANQSHDVQLVLPVKAWMVWKGELACLTGVLTFFLFFILALTSLPSVGQTLNWAEWRLVQSKLGTVALFLAVSHAYVMGIPSWIKYAGVSQLLRSITFTSTVLPALVLILKLLLASPGISGRLRKIRRGWEAKQDCECSDEEEVIGKDAQAHVALLPSADETSCGCRDQTVWAKVEAKANGTTTTTTNNNNNSNSNSRLPFGSASSGCGDQAALPKIKTKKEKLPRNRESKDSTDQEMSTRSWVGKKTELENESRDKNMNNGRVRRPSEGQNRQVSNCAFNQTPLNNCETYHESESKFALLENTKIQTELCGSEGLLEKNIEIVV